MNCPKCGQDVSDSFQEAELDVGIMGSGWYCDACDLPIDDEGREPLEDDVDIFASSRGAPTADLSGKCPYCFTPLEMGYGLAGGGFGPYMYCPANHCGKGFIKSQDPS